jgi:hypothetical protein
LTESAFTPAGRRIVPSTLPVEAPQFFATANQYSSDVSAHRTAAFVRR